MNACPPCAQGLCEICTSSIAPCSCAQQGHKPKPDRYPPRLEISDRWYPR